MGECIDKLKINYCDGCEVSEDDKPRICPLCRQSEGVKNKNGHSSV